MSRHIDADLLLEQLNKKKSEIAKGRYTEGFNDAIMRVRSMVSSSAIADVVPKSEVERLQEEIETLKDNNEHLAVLLTEAKQEVAKEIFEKIEKIRLKEIHKCETLQEQENEVSQRKYWEGGYNSLRQLSYWIAELEKKYVVETPIVRDLAEEAVNRDITNKQNEE